MAFAQIRQGARIGQQCVIGKSVFIDTGVRVGSRVKIQNNVSIYQGVSIDDGVFIDPHVCFTNDKYPRAITPEGELRCEEDWQRVETRVCYGASIGANATIRAGLVIGRWAMIGSGSVVTKNVPSFGKSIQGLWYRIDRWSCCVVRL